MIWLLFESAPLAARRRRFAWLTVLGVAAAACGLDSSGLDADTSDATTAGSGPGGANVGGQTGLTGNNGGGGAQGGQPSAGDGGGGGAPMGGAGGQPKIPMCGDGIIDENEQCDDGAGSPSPYCDACSVVCDGQYDVLEPTTFHCYYDTVEDGQHPTWSGGRDACQNVWGGDLVVISSPAELAFVQGLAPNGFNEDRWIGATDSGTDVFEWVNGEPWVYAAGQAPWQTGHPIPASTGCVALRASGALAEVSCGQAFTHYMCERPPIGTPL